MLSRVRGRSVIGAVGAAVLLSVVSACGSDTPTNDAVTISPSTPSAPPSTSTPSPTARTIPTVTRAADLATGLEVPWGVAALPGTSDVLVAERVSGRIDRVSLDGGRRTTVGTISGVVDRGEGGLLGLAVSPRFLEDQTIYAYFTGSNDNRVVRIRLANNTLGDPAPIITGIPAGSIHDGGRLAFGPDGKLWITTGDAGEPNLAQDRSSLAGKILRAEADGSIPSDNPFGSLVWSYGHRNVQGIAWDSRGQAWATEFGSNERDELNLLRKGGNFGWPIVEGPNDDDRFVAPAVSWPTSEASPSGLAIVDDIAYVAALRGQRIWQVPLTGDSAEEPRAALTGELGRIRSIEPAPDGDGLIASTSNRDGRGNPRPGDDKLVRVTLT